MKLQKSIQITYKSNQRIQFYNSLICVNIKFGYFCLQIQQIDSAYKRRQQKVLQWTKIIMIMEGQQVRKNIIDKYEQSYYFFQSKPVNQLIYDVGNQSTCAFNYLKNFYDTIQYLRRVYVYTNSQGKPEIMERIKLISDYYTEAKMMTCQVPMMIITNTKSIFIKRAKRLKKIQAGQGSSDQTEQNQSIFDFSTKSNYLNSLKRDITQLLGHDEIRDYSLYQQEMDSQVHEVYGRQQQIHTFKQKQTQKFLLKKIQQSQLSHLVCNFNDVDVEAVSQMIQEMKKTKTGSLRLNSIIQSQTHQSNFQNSMKNQNQNRNNYVVANFQKKNQKTSHGQNQNHIHKSLIGSYLQLFQNKKHRKHASIHEMHNTLVSEVVQQYSKKDSLKNYGNIQKQKLCTIQNQEDSLSRQKKQRESNRKKIRQKAEKLLLRIKNQEKMIR